MVILILQGEAAQEPTEDEEGGGAPLDLSWPDSCRERVTYILFLPIIIPLWITLPDTRSDKGIKKPSIHVGI